MSRHPGVFGPRPKDKQAEQDLSEHHLFQKPMTEIPPPRQPVSQPEPIPPPPEQLPDPQFITPPTFPCKLAVFDLETRRSADEVGGWSNIDKMGMSCGVVYDSVNQTYYTYEEPDAHLMVDHLMAAQVIVGFNQIAFDNKVLYGLTGRRLDEPHQVNLDLMASIQANIGHRVALDSVAEATLGRKKSADGLQALRWWKEGKIDEIKTYCRLDVEVTLQILAHGYTEGRINYLDKRRSSYRTCHVDWRRILELSA